MAIREKVLAALRPDSQAANRLTVGIAAFPNARWLASPGVAEVLNKSDKLPRVFFDCRGDFIIRQRRQTGRCFRIPRKQHRDDIQFFVDSSYLVHFAYRNLTAEESFCRFFERFDRAVEKEEAVILTPKPAPAPRLNGPRVIGARPGNPFLFRIPATGTRPITFSVEQV